MNEIKIACPKCNWQPDANLTGRVAAVVIGILFLPVAVARPCKKVWEQTQCIYLAGGCTAWSPHLDWYKGLDTIIEKLKEEIKKNWTVPV